MYFQEVESVRNDRMLFAGFLALAAHLFLILGLSFEASESRSYERQLKVTLATRPSNTVAEDAEHIAQFDQIGKGKEAAQDFATRTQPTLSKPSESRQANPLEDSNRGTTEREVPVVATTSRASRKVLEDLGTTDAAQRSQSAATAELEQLQQEIVNQEALLAERARKYADRPRVRRLTSVSAKRAVDAAYLHGWTARLEAVGNKYYPEASLRYGIYGELRLLVIVNQDGNLEQLEVLSSSGYAVLDEAAMKIVRLAAPFEPFPAELRATTDRLEIIRTWHFGENQLSSG